MHQERYHVCSECNYIDLDFYHSQDVWNLAHKFYLYLISYYKIHLSSFKKQLFLSQDLFCLYNVLMETPLYSKYNLLQRWYKSRDKDRLTGRQRERERAREIERLSVWGHIKEFLSLCFFIFKVIYIYLYPNILI